MKPLSRIFALLLIGSLAIAASTASAAVQQGKAVVQSVRGSAEYSTGGAWAPLKAGLELTTGATVRTAADSEAVLNMGVNGQAVVVTAGSTLTLDKLVFESTGADTVAETQLDLKVGRIIGNVNKTSPASRFEIKTPTGVAGIRGTKFDIASNGVVKVKNGCVVVVYVAPSGNVSSYEVCGGFKFVPGVGVVPMTNDEIRSSDWDKFTGNDQAVRVGFPTSGGVLFVAPTIGVSPFAPTNTATRPAP